MSEDLVECDNFVEGPHLKLLIDDNEWTKISILFPESIRFITNNLSKGNVLVHCQAGISRSVTIVAGFLMNAIHCSVDDAITHIKSIRTQSNPNKGFIEELATYKF